MLQRFLTRTQVADNGEKVQKIHFIKCTLVKGVKIQYYSKFILKIHFMNSCKRALACFWKGACALDHIADLVLTPIHNKTYSRTEKWRGLLNDFYVKRPNMWKYFQLWKWFQMPRSQSPSPLQSEVGTQHPVHGHDLICYIWWARPVSFNGF